MPANCACTSGVGALAMLVALLCLFVIFLLGAIIIVIGLAGIVLEMGLLFGLAFFLSGVL